MNQPLRARVPGGRATWIHLVATGIAGLLTAIAPLSALGADSGFYIGAGAVQAQIKDSAQNPNGAGTIDFDSDDTSYKVFGGYRLSAIPLLDFAAEIGYVDFGGPSQTSLGQNVEYKLHGVDLLGYVIFPLGPIDLYGKAGAIQWNLDKKVGGTSTSDSGTAPVYGAGVGFRVWKLGVRAEYEYYDVSDLDRVQAYSVSVLFQF